MTNAFLTGSRAYGTPREDSDWDLCVLMEKTEKVKLERVFGTSKGIRMGTFNLIALTDPKEFECWWKATEYLKGIGPVTCDTAIKAIDHAKKLAGIKESNGGWSG